jgi:quercetin dioxygenase-like cupin family protein
MLITRWQAPVIPNKEQVRMIFLSEGLSPQEEIYPPHSTVATHRHPFDEVRMILEGELLLNVSGNQVLLRPGDRIVIPSNTKHETKTHGEGSCVSMYSRKSF